MSDIQLANSLMGIVRGARFVGTEMPDTPGNMKLYCPFGHLFHRDGGREKALRIYEATNSAYCFACGEYYDAVKFISLYKDLSRDEATEFILDYVGYTPPDIDSQWAEVTKEEEFNTDSLVDALALACERFDPNWEVLQYEEEIASKFQRCLSLLAKVKSPDDATIWLATTKKIMRNVLGAAS